ncbi:uncharacterized protein LOC117322456 [Pecten maximus]|uniref:uncharacterized protein LOC117322456 n=1 Tax=Pecten maximus TaxID=6579 RepID=UPI001458E330|nr:uncharacterized protein LOC117322456 [Pecten maximus]
MFVNAAYALEKRSWDDSNTFCRIKGGVLADVRENQKSLERIAKELNITNSKPTFWVALNRANTPTKQITGSSSFNTYARCFYIKHDGSRSRHKNCDDMAFASCRKKDAISHMDLTPTKDDSSSEENSTSSIQVTDISIGVVTTVLLTTVIVVAAMTVYIGKLRKIISADNIEDNNRTNTDTQQQIVPDRSNEDEDGYEIPNVVVNDYVELVDISNYDEMSSYEWFQGPDTSENPYRQLNSGEDTVQGSSPLGHYESLDTGSRSANNTYTSLT